MSPDQPFRSSPSHSDVMFITRLLWCLIESCMALVWHQPLVHTERFVAHNL
jgi:hypothetical protein